MKIAYIYDVIYPYVKGGAEKRFWELAKRLSSKGHQVHIFGMKSWQGQASLIKDGVYIHGICKHRQLYLKTGLRSIRQVLHFTMHIFPSLWKEKFDLIDCNAFPYLPFFPVKLLSSFKKIPLVVTYQEIWGNYWYAYLGKLKGLIAKLIERAVIELSDNLIVYSFNIKKELIRRSADEKNKNMNVIPNGIDLEMIERIPPSQQGSDLIFAGRLIKEKNVAVLIESVSSVKKSLSNIRCIIVGGGPEKQSLIALSDRLGLRDNIIFKDFLENEEVISLMKASKVFVFPSRREGFGIAVLEAMASGLAVITVNHPMNSASELIRDGKNGFICKLDKKDIAHNILKVLTDDNLRNNLSKFARDYVKEYDWARITELNEQFYNYVINKRNLHK